MQSYKKYFKLNAEPSDVYNALTNKTMLEIWTGDAVDFVAEEGTDFSLWDGSICGKNIKFEQDKLIEQIWFFDELESKVTIKFHDDGKGGSSVELRHENIPDEAYDNIVAGWEEDYFGALAELFT